MRLNGPRRKSRDTDGNDITGYDANNEQIEARLRDAADFEPDEEPAYDFIAVALRHRRVGERRASLAGLVLTGLAGMSAAVILAVVATLLARGQTDAGARLMPTPKGYDGATVSRSAGTNSMNGIAAIGAAKQEERTEGAQPGTAARRSDGIANRQSGQEEQDGNAASQPGPHFELAHMTANTARHRTHRRATSSQDEDAPEVHWQTESVQRSTTGVLTSGWVLHPDGEHGEMTATPVMLDVPLHSGEAHQSSDHGDRPGPQSLTLTSLDGDRP